MGLGNRGETGSFILIHEATTISFWTTTATNKEGLLVLDVFDSFPTYFADSTSLPDFVACLVTPPASLPVAGPTRSRSSGRPPALQSPGALPPLSRGETHDLCIVPVLI